MWLPKVDLTMILTSRGLFNHICSPAAAAEDIPEWNAARLPRKTEEVLSVGLAANASNRTCCRDGDGLSMLTRSPRWAVDGADPVFHVLLSICLVADVGRSMCFALALKADAVNERGSGRCFDIRGESEWPEIRTKYAASESE